MFGMSALNRKPRQYSYKPLYYNPDKEDREQRISDALGQGDQNYVPGKYIQSQRRNRMLGLNIPVDKKIDKKRVLIRICIVITLMLLMYLLLISNVLDDLIIMLQ